MKAKIVKIFRNKADKQGNPFIFKTGPRAGQAYSKIALLIDNPVYIGKYINGFEGPATIAWKEGDEITIEITEREWQGQKFYDFRVPKPIDQAVEIRLQAIEGELSVLKATVKTLLPKVS